MYKYIKHQPLRKPRSGNVDLDFFFFFLGGGASLKSNMEHNSHVIFLLSSTLRKITEAVNKNKTYCFSTEKGPFGWCATCKVGLIFSITKRSRRDAVSEGLLI